MDPVAGLPNPLEALPVPPEIGNLPQLPLTDLPPLRLSPNQDQPVVPFRRSSCCRWAERRPSVVRGTFTVW